SSAPEPCATPPTPRTRCARWGCSRASTAAGTTSPPPPDALLWPPPRPGAPTAGPKPRFHPDAGTAPAPASRRPRTRPRSSAPPGEKAPPPRRGGCRPPGSSSTGATPAPCRPSADRPGTRGCYGRFAPRLVEENVPVGVDPRRPTAVGGPLVSDVG